MLPGQLVQQIDNPRIKVVPLTDKLIGDLNLKNTMKGFRLLMVVKVEFADGSSFNDEETYSAMTDLLEKLNEALYQKERLDKLPTKKQQ